MRLGKTKKPEPPPDRVIKEGEQPEKLEPQKPKKPRKWDGWLSVAFISICILMTLIFSGTEFDLNAKVAAGLMPIGLCYYTYYIVFARRKRNKKYNEDMSEYEYSTRMASNTRYRKTAEAKSKLEVERIVEENLRRETRAWDTRDLFPNPGRVRVGKMFKK
jgi:hypothetical protein